MRTGEFSNGVILPADVVLAPAWWFHNEGITFEEDFFYDPVRRVEVEQKMEKAQIPDLEDIQTMAQLEGVEFIACRMTVDMMELKDDDFIEGVKIWTAEDFLKFAKDCRISLFT